MLLERMVRLAKDVARTVPIQELEVDQAKTFNLHIERYKSIEANFLNFSFYETRKIRIGKAKRKVSAVWVSWSSIDL
jgi:hypothetical protein